MNMVCNAATRSVQNMRLTTDTCSSRCRTDTLGGRRLRRPRCFALPRSRRLRGDCTPENGWGFSWRRNTNVNVRSLARQGEDVIRSVLLGDRETSID